MLVHQTVRLTPKAFRQRRPDPKNPGGWIWNLEGVDPVLYHLPQVLAAMQRGEPIYVVEGEKDAEALHALGLTATCNAMGAGKWRPSYSEALRGASVVVLPDNDPPGHQHAREICTALAGIAAQCKIVPLHTDTLHSDVSDWLHAGGTRTALEATRRCGPLGDDAPARRTRRPRRRWHLQRSIPWKRHGRPQTTLLQTLPTLATRTPGKMRSWMRCLTGPPRHAPVDAAQAPAQNGGARPQYA